MKLIGQLDSPFVRRVAVTLRAYGLAFERQVISVYGDFDAVRAVNPLGRVPALALDEGGLLFDSLVILDYLDQRVGPAKALTPLAGPARWAVLSHVGVGQGLMEKSVEYRTETLRRPADKVVAERAERIEAQIAQALAWLEAKAAGEWLCGAAMTQADITAAVAYTNLSRKSPALIAPGAAPRLAALTQRCEALACFRAAPFDGD